MNGASECVSSRSLQKFEMVKRAWTKTQKRKPLTSFPEISFEISGSSESKTAYYRLTRTHPSRSESSARDRLYGKYLGARMTLDMT